MSLARLAVDLHALNQDGEHPVVAWVDGTHYVPSNEHVG
jgi:hypothetical protein